MEAESFFARWSQRNAQAAEERMQAAAADPPASGEMGSTSIPAQEKAPPTLEDVAHLTHDSDFKPFVGRGIDENVRRSAMKKMFTDPHFNVMDGLDVYIEDYHRFEPVTAAMLAIMNHAQVLLNPLAQAGTPLMRLLDPADKPGDTFPSPSSASSAAEETGEAEKTEEIAAAPQATSTQEQPPHDDPIQSL